MKIENIYRNTAAALLFTLGTGVVEGYAQNQTQQATAPATNPAITGTRIDPSAGPQSPDVPVQAQTPVTTPDQGAPSQAPSNAVQTADVNPQSDQAATAQNGTDAGTQARPAEVPKAPPTTQQPTTPQEPAGAATAEKAVTRGGVASRPAGVAIAPAKQRQTRSLLIKTGVILAGAIAIGTVYGLHKATPSNPPGASTSTTGH